MAASTSVGDLCRLCGTDTLNIVRNAIFEGEGRVKKYALKISECLTLQVTQEDRLPKIMCGECTYKLDLISDFRDKAFKTETLLISKLDLDVVKPEIPDEDDGPDLNNDDVGGDDFHSSSPEPPIEPEVVVKEEDHAVEKRPGCKAATKRSMRESESEEEEEEAPAKKRGRKPKETPTATATAPVAAPPKENTGPTAVRAAVFICAVCHELFSTDADMRQHLQTCTARNQEPLLTDHASPPLHECKLCGVRVSDIGLHLKLHWSSVAGTVKCLHFACRNRYFAPSQLSIHHRWHKTGMEHFCHVCGRYLASAESLQSHKLLHPNCNNISEPVLHIEMQPDSKNDDPVPSKCKYCCIQINKQSVMKTHMSKHLTKIPGLLRCVYSDCSSIMFSTIDLLRNHVQGRHKKFYCDVCSCSFTSIDSLVKHKEQHVQPSVFPCRFPRCSASFKTLKKLGIHVRKIHNSDEKQCMLCGQYIMLKDLFWPHVKEHEAGTVGLVKCAIPDCNMVFDSLCNLKLHVKNRHILKTPAKVRRIMKCDVCSKQFKRLFAMERHVLEHVKMAALLSLPLPSFKPPIATIRVRSGTHRFKLRTCKN